MGWYGDYNSVEEIQTEVTREHKGASFPKSTVVKDKEQNCYVIWMIAHLKKTNENIIACAVIDRTSRGSSKFVYKPMDESVHPFYYSCPLEYLNETETVNQQWRDNVIRYHEKHG